MYFKADNASMCGKRHRNAIPYSLPALHWLHEGHERPVEQQIRNTSAQWGLCQTNEQKVKLLFTESPSMLEGSEEAQMTLIR